MRTPNSHSHRHAKDRAKVDLNAFFFKNRCDTGVFWATDGSLNKVMREMLLLTLGFRDYIKKISTIGYPKPAEGMAPGCIVRLLARCFFILVLIYLLSKFFHLRR